ncbi:hypothetical protein FKW77_008174 [Venturia effusa]|uniref:Uncharacterized protein n=1 Tax=Venturia effusa TaxID=50376 RepID=A0A517LJA4_9PEZI|nr:hypothetical protein FKW77_008174 [Venturia effusa]
MELPEAKPTLSHPDAPTTNENAHFLTLPRELRQSILLHTYDEDTPLHTNHFIDHFLKRKDSIAHHVKLLRLIHSSLCEDVDYAKKNWQRSYHNKTDDLKKEARRYWKEEGEMVGPYFLPFGALYLPNSSMDPKILKFASRLRTMNWNAKHPILKHFKELKRILAPDHPVNDHRRLDWWVVHDENLRTFERFMKIFDE